MSKYRLGLLVATIALTAGCQGQESNPEPQPPAPTTSKSGCPTPSAGHLTQSDIALTDPTTCKTVFAGEIARSVRAKLERKYEVVVVLPIQGMTHTCSKNGAISTIDGFRTPALGFCDGKKVFIVTSSGISERINGSRIASVWYILSYEAADVRFTTIPQQLCAAGHITTQRPDATPEADVSLYKTVTYPNWSEPAKPWQYILHGQQAALKEKPISACDNPQPVLATASA